MDPILALAIFTFIIFLALCVLGIVYISTVRPTMLAMEEPDPEITRSVGGGSLPTRSDVAADLAALRATLDDIRASVVTANSRNSQQLDEQLERIRQISERLSTQDAHLQQLGQRMDNLREDLHGQSDMLRNATNLLQDLGQTGALAILAGRVTDMGEQMDSMAEQVGIQEDLLREIHAQAAPARASETLYSLLAKQATYLDGLARQLQQIDKQLGTASPGVSPAQDLSPLQTEYESINAALVRLQEQFTQQEEALRAALASQTNAPDDSPDSSTGVAHLESRLVQQAEQLTQEAEKRGELTAKLDMILAKLEDVDDSVEVIKDRKPTRQRQPDRLTDIKGIGAVFAGMLYERGIDTYEELAAFTPDELRNLFTIPRWRGIDAEAWIEQANNLAVAKAKTESSS